jgi:serine/threonine-protein kinase
LSQLEAKRSLGPAPPSTEATRGVAPTGGTLPEAFAVGRVLGGKFRVEGVVGGGGMGIVVAARHLALDQRVAIKFLRPEVSHDAETVARFAREARAAVRVRSEHVARVLDVGEADGGAPFLVMELLEGHTMAAELARRRRLPTEEAVDYVLQLCEALAEAHAAGIVHRDLKPENLFLTDRAHGWRALKVLDFGISKAAPTGAGGGRDALLTQTLSMMGSPMYMSPEQIRATKHVDHRADIWSVGIVLYEMLAGRAAYQAGSITELCANVLEESPEPLARAAPSVPAGLAAAVDRCLEKNVRRRYQNVGELAVDLLPFGPRRAHASVERIVSVLRTARMHRGELAVPSEAPRPAAAPSAVTVSRTVALAGRGRAAWRLMYAFSAGVGAASFVGALGAFAWLYARGRVATSPPTSTAHAVVVEGASEGRPPPVDAPDRSRPASSVGQAPPGIDAGAVRPSGERANGGRPAEAVASAEGKPAPASASSIALRATNAAPASASLSANAPPTPSPHRAGASPRAGAALRRATPTAASAPAAPAAPASVPDLGF